MTEFLQQLVNGLSLGAIYALLALGYTMVYGVLRFINFAHSDVFMVGAFAGLYLAPLVPADTILGGVLVVLGAMLICAVLGALIERFAYRPLRNAPTLNVLITAIGVSCLLQALGQLVFGAAPRAFPAVFPARALSAGGLDFSSNQVVVLLVALVLAVALRFIVFRTKMGAALRAVSQNPRAARLMGLNNDVVIRFAFVIGSALAGAGGVLYATNYPSIDPFMGVLPGLKAFIAAILGGIGSIPGAALGGLLLGLVETFVGGSEYSTYKDAIAFALLILFLLFRPAGLLGKPRIEKV